MITMVDIVINISVIVNINVNVTRIGDGVP